MKAKRLGLLIVMVGISTFACAGQDTRTTPTSQSAAAPSPVDPLAAVKDHYAGKCVACHGERGEGAQVKLEDITLQVPTLREGHAVTHTDEQLVKQILDGGEGMPAFKDKLSTKEATELVQYIRREFQGK